MTSQTEKGVTAARFAFSSRMLHWLMAPMVIVQLLIGVTMIASLSYYPQLLAVHRRRGVLTLPSPLPRWANRPPHKLPPFLATMSPAERKVASWSERLLYTLLIIQPLSGW